MRQRLRGALVLAACLLAGSAGAWAQSTTETIAQVKSKIVKIFGAGGIQRLHEYSTGFLVTPQGHIVTVWSHVLDTDDISVVLDTGRRYQAKVLGAEPPLDLAVLKIDASDLPHFDLNQEYGEADVGTRVLGFSNMFKVATGDEPVSVLHGVIAAKTKLSARRGVFEVPYTGTVYLVDAITNNPGAGGGVITTRDGKLLGMIGKEVRNAQSNVWINYSIPIRELKRPIEEIVSGKFSSAPTTEDKINDPKTKPRRYRALDFGIVLVPDVLFRTPAFVDAVVPGSAAAAVDVRPDDLVLFVNETLIQSVKMLEDELGALEAGDTLRLVLRRGTALVSVEIPVPAKGERP